MCLRSSVSMKGVRRFKRLMAQGLRIFSYLKSSFLPIFSNISIFFFLISSLECAISSAITAYLSKAFYSTFSTDLNMSIDTSVSFSVMGLPLIMAYSWFIWFFSSLKARRSYSEKESPVVRLRILIFCSRVCTALS